MIEWNYIEFLRNLHDLPTPEIALALGVVMALGVVEYCNYGMARSDILLLDSFQGLKLLVKGV
jgi:hypothetical protein